VAAICSRNSLEEGDRPRSSLGSPRIPFATGNPVRGPSSLGRHYSARFAERDRWMVDFGLEASLM
jgi:hypothetical protein